MRLFDVQQICWSESYGIVDIVGRFCPEYLDECKAAENSLHKVQFSYIKSIEFLFQVGWEKNEFDWSCCYDWIIIKSMWLFNLWSHILIRELWYKLLFLVVLCCIYDEHKAAKNSWSISIEFFRLLNLIRSVVMIELSLNSCA